MDTAVNTVQDFAGNQQGERAIIEAAQPERALQAARRLHLADIHLLILKGTGRHLVMRVVDQVAEGQSVVA